MLIGIHDDKMTCFSASLHNGWEGLLEIASFDSINSLFLNREVIDLFPIWIFCQLTVNKISFLN